MVSYFLWIFLIKVGIIPQMRTIYLMLFLICLSCSKKQDLDPVVGNQPVVTPTEAPQSVVESKKALIAPVHEFYVQVGAFKSLDNASNFKALIKRTGANAILRKVNGLNLVEIGPFKDEETAVSHTKKIRSQVPEIPASVVVNKYLNL